MDTPKTEAGRLTDKIMLRIKDKRPELKGSEYNQIYSAVHEVLNQHLPKQPLNRDQNGIYYSQGRPVGL